MEQRLTVLRGGMQQPRPGSILRRSILMRGTENERILLGHMMCTPELIKAYRPAIAPEDFVDEYDRQLYQVLQEYERIYGVEEIGKDHFCAACRSLAEKGVQLSKINVEVPWPQAQMIRSMGKRSAQDNPAYQTMMKAIILRKMEQSGYQVDELLNRSDFSSLTVRDLQRLIYEDLDRRLNVAVTASGGDLGADMTSRAAKFLGEPEVGYQTPFPFINEHCHGLFRNDLNFIGGLSNTGKGRLLMFILTWLVIKEGQSVCLLSNEMAEEDFFKCLVCTVVNHREFHGYELSLTQSDIVQGRFRDGEGRYLTREEGEEKEDFQRRLERESSEYRDFQAVTRWWDERFKGKFRFVQVGDDYSIQRLKQEIRLAKDKGCTVVAYDTFKAYGSSEWTDTLQAATELSALFKADPDGLTGLATFQLTEEALEATPDQLSQRYIARAKSIYQQADSMIMFLPLNPAQRSVYVVSRDGVEQPIPPETEIAAFRIVKNRRGQGKDVSWVVQTCLDRNIWHCAGQLKKKRGA